MEQIFYLAVKTGVLVYVLVKLWKFLFRHNGHGIWNWTTPKKHKGKSNAGANLVPSATPAKTSVSENDIIGASKTEYIEDPYAVKLILSEELPKADPVETEPDINPDEVEATLQPDQPTDPREFLDDDELADPASGASEPAPEDAGFSTGLTFTQLLDAVKLVEKMTEQNGADDDYEDPDESMANGCDGISDEKIIRAALTINDSRQTDLYELFLTRANSEEIIGNFLDNCIDANGLPLNQPLSRKKYDLSDFDIGDYV